MTGIRILVTGSRAWVDQYLLREALLHAAVGHDEVTLVHGRCDPRRPDGSVVRWDAALRARPAVTDSLRGADWLADRVAVEQAWAVEQYPANWHRDGKAAGPLRNSAMVGLGAEVCIAFPLGQSAGTWDCVRKARAAGIPVRVIDP